LKKLNHILPKPHGWLLGAVSLYLLSFLFTPRISPINSLNAEIKSLESYIHEREQEFDEFSKDTYLVKRLANKNESEEELKQLIRKTTGLFIFKKSSLLSGPLFWSNQRTYPPDQIFTFTDTTYFKQLEKGNGFYICVKKTLPEENGDSIIAIGMIPVMYRYFSDLPDRFEHDPSANILISGLVTEYPIKNISGRTLFYISPKSRIDKPSENISIYLRLAAMIFLFIYIHLIAERIAERFGFWKGLIFLFIVLFSLRLISYFFPFPVNFRQFELFDPSNYASSEVHKSLGDLLINACLFSWLILFSLHKLQRTGFYNVPSGRIGKLIGGFASLAVITLTFIVAYTIRSIAAHSTISFDVINFFSLSPFTVFGFIALAILAVGYYYFMRIMNPLLSVAFNNNFYPVYLIVAVAGLTFLTFQVNDPLLPFYIYVLGWLVIYIWLSRLNKFGISNQRQSMAGALFWIFIFSVSITAIIIDANREKEWQNRINIANKIDERTDPTSAKELSVAFVWLDNDFLSSNFYRFKDPDLAAILRDSIMHKSDFPINYNSQLYLFDADKKSLFNEEPESFNTFQTVLAMEAKASEGALYYVERGFDKYTYIFQRTIRDENKKILGYLFIVSKLEQYDKEALVAELFRGSENTDFEKGGIYSWATYIDGRLSVGPGNKYPFPTMLDPKEIPKETIEKRIKKSYTELWYKAKGNTIIVVARKKADALEAITLFSYIFCVFLFLVAFFNLFLLLLRMGGNVKELRKILEWNIRTQIHGTIIFISVLSFLIIGASTISFFILRYEQGNREKLSKTMEVMMNEMGKRLVDRLQLDDKLAIYDSVANDDIQGLVNDVAEIHGVDVNVYDTVGSLHVTSQPVIYRENFISREIHPEAFYYLNREHRVLHVQQEKLAHISYMSIYAPLRGNDGVTYAYINIPYFLSQQELKQEISNFLVTIINLNAFIFLVSGVIALFITNRVTRSFLLISEKMQQVNLGQTNEVIDWKRNDEIGDLVREYNKMVKKLEVSADALAKSEREGAWREMARQVAHEIKNPLTPMKLSIQFLQKSIDNNSDNVKELTGKVANTLVEQIDHLSKIAFDFSQFANIGNTNIETFDINEVIRSLDNLYKTSHEGELKLQTVPGKVMVRADKTQMNRLFTNLIQNAIEACNDKGKCDIELKEVRTDGIIQISIKDNGEGIPKEMQSKIFIPNFTTKSSGTGLGLAMCKGIAEQAGGKIWFETKTGEGSTFFVELPVAN
jgi:two-component system nitrogen regulation sensor histidine kinase NtrY